MAMIQHLLLASQHLIHFCLQLSALTPNPAIVGPLKIQPQASKLPWPQAVACMP